jgi:sulfatase maturation enzyme AslB (radical SAM superfamily)
MLVNPAINYGRAVSGVPDVDSLILILTAQCNLQCSYCYQTAKKALAMDRSTLRASLDLAFASASQNIELLFVGGEPLLEWPQIVEAVSYVCHNAPPGKCIDFEIISNGLLITDEIAAFLDEHKFKVQLSFDGIEAAQNCRGEGTFKPLDSLLTRLQKRRPDLFRSRLRVIATQIPSTIPYLAQSVRYLMQKGVRDIGISPSLTPFPGWAKESIHELDSQFRQIYEENLRHFERTGDVVLGFLCKYKSNGGPPDVSDHICVAMTGKSLVVDVDGEVYGCVLFAESYQEFTSEFLRSRLTSLRMGGLRAGKFQDRRVAYGEAIKSTDIFREREKSYSSYGKCADCQYFDNCSVCPVSIGYDPDNADPHRIPDFICAFNQVAFKYRELFPCMPDPLGKISSTLKKLAATRSTKPIRDY